MTTNPNYPPPCTCSTCQNMCETRPCQGSPREIFKLLIHNPSISRKLMRDYWVGDESTNYKDVSIVSPAIIGHEMRDAPSWPKGKCTLQDPQTHLCLIHSHKPFEGKIAHHSNAPSMSIHRNVAMSWNTKRGRKVFSIWSEMVNY